MSARRSSRSRSKPRSKRDGEGSGSESESAPEPSPAELSSEEEEFAESQPKALVFPAQGVPFVPLAADLQEVAPGALALPEGSL